VEPIEAGRAFEQILAVARQRNLTEDDASCLELALRTGVPLTALDGNVKRAARLVDVSLVKI
jgi:hypothetical protein